MHPARPHRSPSSDPISAPGRLPAALWRFGPWALAAGVAWSGLPGPRTAAQEDPQQAPPAPQTSATSQARPDDEAPLAEGLAALIDGQIPITLAEYSDYLLARSGRRPLNELIYRRVLAQRAAEAGLQIRPEQVAESVEAAWSQLLDLRHGGDEEALAAELWTAGFRVDEHLQNVRSDARRDALEDALCRHRRVLDEPTLRARFDQEYGVDGERVELWHLLVSKSKVRAELVAAGRPVAELTDAVLDEAMLARAEGLLAQLRDGAEFEALAKTHSHDSSVRSNGGRIPGYNYARYGAPMAAAVRTARVGEPAGPVVTAAGVHLILVESRTVTAFEDVSAELRERLAAEPASWEERSRLRAELLGSTPTQTY
jgi:hypothetical protein